MISNLNGSGSDRVHRKKAVFTGSRFGSTPCASESLNFEKQKECYASQHTSRDFLRISSGSNIVTKRFLFKFMNT